MSLFDLQKDQGRTAAIRRLKQVARGLFNAGEDDAVVVNELACTEPGCPPVETVIALLRAGHAPRQLKVHKPAVDVTADDIQAALARSGHHHV